MTIPGVGPVTAITLLALFRRYPETNRKQIVALAGLDPMEYRSGSSVHKETANQQAGER
jgi:transposase